MATSPLTGRLVFGYRIGTAIWVTAIWAPPGYTGRGNRYAGLRRGKHAPPAIYPLSHHPLTILVLRIDCAADDPEWDYDDWRGSLTGSSMDGPRNGRFRSMMGRGMGLEDCEEWRDELDEDWLVRSQRRKRGRRRGF
ncbi:hypothetical protein Tdes44962_MAKER04738 [Teratosphaeria destructans]|uniref:Uncharacterized protein n=1 Tax=Teratosphaeria destructans TaxID=418781 RepID=A0A9W7SLQ4_9PEZI|nr:hypothetical protein Tdes44962_MAKER04738 [Teratosphaeria destructans]